MSLIEQTCFGKFDGRNKECKECKVKNSCIRQLKKRLEEALWNDI